VGAFAAVGAPAAESVIWFDDYAAAVALARRQEKLLFVVDLADDFSLTPAAAVDLPPGNAANPVESPLAKLYHALATSEERVAKLLAAHFVSARRYVGPTKTFERFAAEERGSAPAISRPAVRAGKRRGFASLDTPAPGGEFAVAYVCLPNQRVLHAITGFVTAEELLAELKWAVAANDLRTKVPPTEAAWLMREQHLAAMDDALRTEFAEEYATKWKADFQAPAAQKKEDLVAAIRTAQTMRERALIERLKANWPADADRRTLLAALAAHGGLEASVVHPVLAEFPLPRLAELSRPLFELTSGQRYWQVSPARDELRAWWAEARADGALTLFVVADDPYYGAAVVAGSPPLTWPPKDPALTAALRNFRVREVTLDELALLAADSALGPIQFRAADGPPRYMVYDARGFRVAELSRQAGTGKKLTQALIAVDRPGEVAADLSVTRGAEDERK
jgi:hypothetical protein